jgi:predicted nucleic acid-binding protein
VNGILVDSDVLIDVLRGRKPEIGLNWQQVAGSGDPVFYSPVSQAEIRQGMRDPERQSVEHLFEVLTCLPVDGVIGQLAGDFLRAFQRSHALELGDALIAATASIHGLALWTHNHKHFPMKDLRFFRSNRTQ